MKICLAMMFQNEADWLKLHLPVLLKGGFDGLVGVDGGSSDGSADMFRSFGGQVYERPFDWNFGAHGNFLIESCEQAGYEAMLRLDPDELMFPQSLQYIRQVFEGGEEQFITLSRYNFSRDREHVNPCWYPDPQHRAWLLNKGVFYTQRVHEIPFRNNLDPVYLADTHIFHYGWIKSLKDCAYKSYAYEQARQGKPLTLSVEDMIEGDYPPAVLFQERQPLEPKDIGVRAPLESR